MEDASTHKDCEKEKEVVDSSNARPDVVGVGLMGADIVRLQANVRELRGLSSPVRRSLFGGAGLTPPTPVTHSTPQLPPLQERSQSGLSTDGEFDFYFILILLVEGEDHYDVFGNGVGVGEINVYFFFLHAIFKCIFIIMYNVGFFD